jgi:hypothetical protein
VDLVTRRVQGAFRVIHTVEGGSRGLPTHLMNPVLANRLLRAF